MTTEILGYDLFGGDIEQLVVEISDAIRSGERSCRVMACLNPHSFVVAKDDVQFCRALRDADWLIPDGIGIVWASQVLGKPLSGRITGPDVFNATMASLDIYGGSVFFLGSSEETLVKIKNKTAEAYPSVRLAGVYSPPFKTNFSLEDNQRMLSTVNAAKPDVLWVGMTAPKQENWLADNRNFLDAHVAGAIGAAFDFFAGNVARSPAMMQSLGLEWLHRSMASPNRLGKRNAISNPKFVIHTLRHKYFRNRN